MGNKESAEDACQNTFLKVHLKCGQFEPGKKFRPWLYTIARHQAIDHQRRNRRHRMLSLDHRSKGQRDDDAGNLGDAVLATTKDDPQRNWARNMLSERLWDAVRSLPEKLREPVLRIHFAGEKYREAAKALDIPVGTAKSRVHLGILGMGDGLSSDPEVLEAMDTLKV